MLEAAGVFLLFVFLERLLALRESRFRRRGWGQDMIYMFINPIFIAEGIVGVLFIWGLYGVLVTLMPEGFRAIVAGLPIWLSIPLAVLVADLGFYLAHRMFHAVPWLWPFHEVHHSSEHLDALAAVRVHPVDQIVTKLFSLVPLLVLGFSREAFFGFYVIYLVQSFYVHSNLKGSWGPFRLALATPEFHHWHHADHKEAYDKNFAGQLPIWDILFGTLHLPKKSWPKKYGLDHPIPESYHRQLIYPFTRVVERLRHGGKKRVMTQTTASQEQPLAVNDVPAAEPVSPSPEPIAVQVQT